MWASQGSNLGLTDYESGELYILLVFNGRKSIHNQRISMFC